MREKFVLLTDDNDTFADVTSDDIVRIRGGLKPSCDNAPTGHTFTAGHL